MKWLPMDQAPLDGTPIVVEHQPKLYGGRWNTEENAMREGWFPTPATVIQEAFFFKERWQPWSGDPKVQSTYTLEPMHWVLAHELRAALED